MFSINSERYTFLTILVSIIVIILLACTISYVAYHRSRVRLRNSASQTDNTSTARPYWPFIHTSKPDPEKTTPKIPAAQISEPSDPRVLDMIESLNVESSEKDIYAQAQRNEVYRMKSPRIFGVVDESGPSGPVRARVL
jgi:hypothetical protein